MTVNTSHSHGRGRTFIAGQPVIVVKKPCIGNSFASNMDRFSKLITWKFLQK